MNLVTKPWSELSPDEQKAVVDIYKMLVDMADKVSQRRQNANNFYLSVNTALIGASAYIGSLAQQVPHQTLAIAAAGLLVSLLWFRNINSYRDLNKGKFVIIQDLELQLPVRPYTAEWETLHRGENTKHYRPFHTVEALVPLVFVGVHLFQVIRVFPWPYMFACFAK